MASIELNLNRGDRNWHITLAWHQETAFALQDVWEALAPLFEHIPFDVEVTDHAMFGRNKDMPVALVSGLGTTRLDFLRRQVVRFNRGGYDWTPHISLSRHADLKVGERLTVTGITYRNKVISTAR